MYTIHAHNTDIVYWVNTVNIIVFMQLAIELIYLRSTAFYIFNVQS